MRTMSASPFSAVACIHAGRWDGGARKARNGAVAGNEEDAGTELEAAAAAPSTPPSPPPPRPPPSPPPPSLPPSTPPPPPPSPPPKEGGWSWVMGRAARVLRRGCAPPWPPPFAPPSPSPPASIPAGGRPMARRASGGWLGVRSRCKMRKRLSVQACMNNTTLDVMYMYMYV